MNRHGAGGALPARGVILLGLISLFWGSNWPLMKIALSQFSPWVFRTLCLSGGAAGLFLLARVRRERLLPAPGEWPRLVWISLFNITAWNLLSVYGVLRLPAGRAAILAYTMPLWSVVLGVAVMGDPLTRRRAAGVLLGASGIALLLWRESAILAGAPLGALLMLAAALAWAIGTVLVKSFPVALPTTAFAAWQMLIGGLPIVAGGVPQLGSIGPVSAAGVLALLYNIVVCFVFCYWAWYEVVAMVPVSVSGLGMLMVPVVGMASGMLLLGERHEPAEYAALALVVGALSTVLIPAGALRRRPAAP
jgi:drug/metabolite transporter (DMT)-like permease